MHWTLFVIFLIQKDLNEHLKLCKKAKCSNFKLNCDFTGTKIECAEHLIECKYNHLKDSLIQKETFQKEIEKINELFRESNEKFDELFISNKNNFSSFERNISDKLGRSFF